ncbi:hypothetical protein AB0L40_22430 [Patulibacter sp. NPDC049589]
MTLEPTKPNKADLCIGSDPTRVVAMASGSYSTVSERVSTSAVV